MHLESLQELEPLAIRCCRIRLRILCASAFQELQLEHLSSHLLQQLEVFQERGWASRQHHPRASSHHPQVSHHHPRALDPQASRHHPLVSHHHPLASHPSHPSHPLASLQAQELLRHFQSSATQPSRSHAEELLAKLLNCHKSKSNPSIHTLE